MKMTLRLAPLLAITLLLGSLSAAHADTSPGWYTDLGVGGTFTPNSKTDLSSGDRTAKFDAGWDVLAGGGYAWSEGWRAEGEVYHSRAAVRSVQWSTGSNGGLSNTDFFANGLYDFNMGSMFTPYVGVGVGFAVPDASHIGALSNGSNFNDNDLQFAYQGIAGVAAQLDYNWAVTADYRYVASSDAKFKTSVGGSGTMENASHNIVLGVRYSYGSPPPMMAHAALPVMAHKSAAKPAVAPIGQSYMVFFDFNKSVLTPEAKTILAKAANDFKAGKLIKVVVVGHTDTVGTAKYNKALSMRRAKAVKAELVADGVADKAVTTVGAGKDGLLVPTADGVREAQNRRAEILFQNK